MALVQAYWRGEQQGDWPFASLLVGSVQINCFFRSAEEIDGDIDPKDLRAVEDHLQLMQYLTHLSLLLTKRVVMLEEGTRVEENNRFNPKPILIID